MLYYTRMQGTTDKNECSNGAYADMTASNMAFTNCQEISSPKIQRSHGTHRRHRMTSETPHCDGCSQLPLLNLCSSGVVLVTIISGLWPTIPDQIQASWMFGTGLGCQSPLRLHHYHMKWQETLGLGLHSPWRLQKSQDNQTSPCLLAPS